jgi:hypothetical protein
LQEKGIRNKGAGTIGDKCVLKRVKMRVKSGEKCKKKTIFALAFRSHPAIVSLFLS